MLQFSGIMTMRVTIFEDDKDFADVLKEYMDEQGFEVLNAYTLKSPGWIKADVVLADFRNKIVSFETVRKECAKLGIPLLAISGFETTFRPQLLKPFTIEDLQSAILETIKACPKRRQEEQKSLISKIMSFFTRNA